MKISWLEIKENVDKAVKFVLPVVDSALAFNKQPGILSGVRLALHAKNAYESVYPKTTFDFTADVNWKKLCSSEVFQRYLLEALKSEGAKITKLTENDQRQRLYWLEYNGYTFGYFQRGVDNSSVWLYVNGSTVLEGIKILNSLLWRDGKQIMIEKKDDVLLIVPYYNDDIFSSIESERLTKEIKGFREKGYSRSYLIYGPPGTGKSNCAAQILSNLGCRTMIFSNISNVEPAWLREHLELFGAEAIIIEDLDRLNIDYFNKILDSLQFFCKKGLLILATCNKIKNMDDALIRAGRFDKCIEIASLPEKVVKNIILDEDLFQIVKNFPIAFIEETRRRYEVLGKEETLRQMDDLIKRVERSRLDEYSI